ncbi:hypothetical protein DENIT_70037 [Pseudomonas veronii]|uniref:hypothetical protein n=1 Tax=Pseudomonas veronii TaxID=76761 RepID=UPI00175410B1|nr:hypothetical protein [Pseudomonas veronii]CAD0266060.1 hypothetical protein DENIT_70037 [Pseudomonas veronii]
MQADMKATLKAKIIDCLSEASGVLHNFMTVEKFILWLQLVDMGNAEPEEILECVRELWGEVYSLSSCLEAYEHVLVKNPGQAMLVDVDEDGDPIYAALDVDGDVVRLTQSEIESECEAQYFGFQYFNDSTGGWGEGTYLDVQKSVDSPQFMTLGRTIPVPDPC